jgi:hypothetical protein
MRNPGFIGAALGTMAFVVAAGPGMAAACDGPREIHEARPLAVRAYVRSMGKKVFTLAGYSGAGYEDRQAMLAAVERALAGRDPNEWIVGIGATAVGIGAAYEVAKRLGFGTLGVVSSLARDEHTELSKCVDVVFYVPDASWGGNTAEGRLSPTSMAVVEAGSEFLAIGGGEATRDEMLAARQAGKPVTFVPADMNHEIARQRAARKGLAVPTDFRGAADAALRGAAS